MTTEQTLQNCTVEGNIVKLPNTVLDRKVYLEVKKALELIGGSWKGGKVAGFVFKQDPTELLNQVANGEKRNLKKEFQFFGTPERLCDELVYLANIQPTDEVLEPSAGQGAIVKSIIKQHPDMIVDCYELMPTNRMILKDVKGAKIVGEDFLNSPDKQYDKIIANPPFSKNQDIDHVLMMHDRLKKGGTLVTIMSTHWIHSKNKKEISFKNWLESKYYTLKNIEAGEFKESGTSVATVLVTIEK
jgi:hypothetical protein